MQTDFPRPTNRGNTIGMVIGYATMLLGILSMGVGGISLLRGSLSDPSKAQAPAEAPAVAAATEDIQPDPVAGAEDEASEGAETDPVAVQEIVIRTIPQQLRYDTTSITVKAGSNVRLTFDNNDILQHNLLVIMPGTQDEVGNAGMAMMSDPAKAIELGYVPEIDAVLHATRMLNGGEAQTLEFTAPATPDTYHYICTFPGHAMLMRGDMIVE